MTSPSINSLWTIGSKVADPLAEAAFFQTLGCEMKAAFLRSPGGILFQLVKLLRVADAACRMAYTGVPVETVIAQ